MLWRKALLITCTSVTSVCCLFTPNHLDSLRNDTLSMFYHGWDNYMRIGFPHDEIRPISCIPLIHDPKDIQMSDVLGGYALTMIDTLDMFAITNETDKFHKYIDLVIDNISFDVNSTVQVFETTIRAMGGLLSSHLYATVPKLGQVKPEYNGELLDMAYDLGERLLKAFDTPTGLPHPRVNLQEGIVKVNNGYIHENCASGVGSLLLEFGLLSRLTGDQRFEFAARRAFLELWARRSSLDLVPMSIDSNTGGWLSPITGVGASIDSLYEYAVKYYVLFGDDQFYSMFRRMYDSLKSNAYDGWVFNNINFHSGTLMTSWIDSLASFFPGLLVLAGELEDAIRMHLAYYKLWIAYAAIPERWSGEMDLQQSSKLDTSRSGTSDSKNKPAYDLDYASYHPEIDLEWWPLRPEFIESNFYLYQATKDPFFLQVGQGVLKDIETNCRTKCGFAGIHDVRTGRKSDRMETFFLSETTKYLYLLFTPEHPLNQEYSNFVFSTEAHPFWYDEDVVAQASVLRFTELGDRVASSAAVIKASSPMDRDQSIFSRLWTGWDNRIKKTNFGRRSRRRLKKGKSGSSSSSSSKSSEPVCQAWKKSANSKEFMNSFVASWDYFYSLNSVYNYTSPGWISSKQPGRKAFELQTEFYDTYIRSGAVCMSTKDSAVYEITFSVPIGGVRASKFTIKDSVIETDTLHGVKWKIEKVEGDEGRDGYKVVSMDQVKVKERTIEVGQVSLDSGSPIEVVAGKLVIDGVPIVNAMVRGFKSV